MKSSLVYATYKLLWLTSSLSDFFVLSSISLAFIEAKNKTLIDTVEISVAKTQARMLSKYLLRENTSIKLKNFPLLYLCKRKVVHEKTNTNLGLAHKIKFPSLPDRTAWYLTWSLHKITCNSVKKLQLQT